MKDSAVLFLIFNRPDTAEQVMKAIQLAKPSKIYIAADGPRAHVKGEAELCHQTRETVLSLITWECQISTLFRERNHGCAKAVAEAIDWFFRNEEMGIILEDDCLPDPSFFSFCSALLAYYKDDNRIMHIGGFNDQPMRRSSASYYFSNYPRIWGWATWRRAWKFYELEPAPLTEPLKSSLIAKYFYNFKKAGERWFYDFSKSRKSLSTWDYQWCLCIWKQHGLSVTSNIPLIKNIGFDARASHTLAPPEDMASLQLSSLEGPVIHPQEFLPNFKADLISIRKNLYPDFQTQVLLKWRSLSKIVKRSQGQPQAHLKSL
jgi:hypothetical protein